MPKNDVTDNGDLYCFTPRMSALPPLNAVRLRRTALMAVPQSRAGVLRSQHAQSRGVPLAFVCLSGVTAMLSAAVRKA